MPNIEIISLRLNLDKADDKKLFDAIASLSDSGKRNHFLKQSLLACLTTDGAERFAQPRQAKKQFIESSKALERKTYPEASKPKAVIPALPATKDSSPSAELKNDNEVAGFVASFVQ